MELQPFAAAIIVFASTSVLSATPVTAIIDISDNLYYSGLKPEKKTTYWGSLIPPLGYPNAPLPLSDYIGSRIGDCLRNRYYEDAGGNERAPNTAIGEVGNTFATDVRVSCFGTPPPVLALADVGVSPGDTLYIKASGIIDDDTQFNYGPGGGISIVDPRGQFGSSGSSDNNINQYAAVGMFVKADSNGTLLISESEFKDYVDASRTVDSTGLSLISAPGFQAVAFNGEANEFGVVEELDLKQVNTLVDQLGDGVSDEGTGEFAGTITVPAGATHVIFAYNAHKGGFYHHGDPAYFGALNPLILAAIPEVDTALLTEHGLFRDGDYTVTVLHEDQFPDDGIDADPGTPRTVGGFKITLSDAPIAGVVMPPVPEAHITKTSQIYLQVQLNANASTLSEGSITQYEWDFGDGTAPAQGLNATHTYAQPGDYQVTLTVTSMARQRDQDILLLTVTAPPFPVPAITLANASDLTVQLDGAGSTIESGSINSYLWDFGDTSAAGAGLAVNHTYSAAGTYNVTLTTTSAEGKIASISQPVTVSAPPEPEVPAEVTPIEETPTQQPVQEEPHPTLPRTPTTLNDTGSGSPGGGGGSTGPGWLALTALAAGLRRRFAK